MKIVLFLTILLFGGYAFGVETEEQTIAKCLEDMKSTDVAIRRRAVLILGKYANNYVYTQLIPYLKDPDARVRQSIVVGFIENRLVLANSIEPLLGRLADEDVHTRRMVSSTLLPQLIYYLAYGDELSPALKKIIVNAVKDEDMLVRKHMLQAYYPLKGVIGDAVFYPLLGDESAEIRLLALNRLSGILTFETIKPYLKNLCEDKNEKIREQVLKSLSGFGPEVKEFLAILANDEKITIAARAMAFSGNADYLPKLQKIILDESSPSDLVVELSKAIVSWNKNSQDFVRSLLNHHEESRRYAALYALTRLSLPISKEDLLRLIKDDSQRIRKIVITHFVRLNLLVPEIAKLALSEYVDVREFILLYIIRNQQQNKEMLEPLYDLMLDQELKIRSLAITAIWECQAADRYDVLSQSLSDSEEEIRNLAARILLNSNDPKAKEIMQQFIKNNPKVDISSLQMLNRISSLHDLAIKKPVNWRQQVKESLNDDNFEIKKAAIDVIVKTRDADLFNYLRNFLELNQNRQLIDYLYERISLEEKIIEGENE